MSKSFNRRLKQRRAEQDREEARRRPRRGLFETPQEYQERCAAEKQREEVSGER